MTGASFSGPPATGEVQVSKAGGAYVDVTGTVVEIGSGSYYYQATTGDVDTLGLLILKVNKSGSTIYKFGDEVIVAPGGQLKPNSFIDNYTYNGDGNPLTWRIRIFANKTAVDAAVAGHSDNTDSEIERYKMTATYTLTALATYKVDRDL